jgi:hypothetical protein
MESTENENKKFGFFILRHVNSEETNKYWMLCYDCIRKFYPENMIIIIDDNSNYSYIINKTLYKTIIVNSEYEQRGELLPYIYYLKIHLFDTALILHDSAFINSYIDLNVDKYKILWSFEHHWDQIEDETKMIELFNDPELLEFYKNKSLWKGCFGGMCIITFEFLQMINKKYDMHKLLDHVRTRYNRCSFERVIAAILQKESKLEVMFGNLHTYIPWGITFNDIPSFQHLPIIKIWTGR